MDAVVTDDMAGQMPSVKVVAIPEFHGRVSPVFDTCGQVLFFTVDERHRETKRLRTEDWSSVPRFQRAQRLRQAGTDLLLCGGISGWLARQILVQGVDVRAWVVGEIAEVLEAYQAGMLEDPVFNMPGCGRGGRQGWRWGQTGSGRMDRTSPRGGRMGGYGPGRGRRGRRGPRGGALN